MFNRSILGGIFWLYRVTKMEAAANYVCHMSDDFGSRHLNQTVLPNTVSIGIIKKIKKISFEKGKQKLLMIFIQLHMYRTVHNLMPPAMSDETYQDGWIAAARSVGITERIIERLAALARN